MHAAGDFLLQGTRLSRHKAVKASWLLFHVGIYTVFFIALSPVLLGLTFMQGLVFSLINGAAHFVIDFFTSKLKKIYWHEHEGKYIAVVSFDHILHLLILIFTFIYLYPEVFANAIKMPFAPFTY